MKKSLTLIWIALVAIASAGGETPEKLNVRERNKATVNAAYSRNVELYGTNDCMLVLPGLLADKTSRCVRVSSEATGLLNGNPVELLLVGESSEHDYEAVAVSFAKPSDIHRALEFIGAKAGRPVDADSMHFWPRGERLSVRFEWRSATGTSHVEKADAFLSMGERKDLAPAEGFVFVGSAMRPAPGNSNKTVYAADSLGPNSIISLYNCPDTVIDVPYQAGQSDVYNAISPNEKVWLSKGQLVDIVIEPVNKGTDSRIVDLTLKVRPGPEQNSAGGVSNMVFDLSGSADQVQVENKPFDSILAAFERLASDRKDVFVTVDFDMDLPLSAVQSLCALLRSMDAPSKIRIEPPVKGQLFYKAFVPDEQLRDRTDRVVHPWELHLVRTNDTLQASLTLIHDVHDPATGKWSEKIEDFDAPTPEAMTNVLGRTDEKGRPLGLRVLFTYAPGSLTYRELMSMVSQALPTHPTVFVYLE